MAAPLVATTAAAGAPAAAAGVRALVRQVRRVLVQRLAHVAGVDRRDGERGAAHTAAVRRKVRRASNECVKTVVHSRAATSVLGMLHLTGTRGLCGGGALVVAALCALDLLHGKSSVVRRVDGHALICNVLQVRQLVAGGRWLRGGGGGGAGTVCSVVPVDGDVGGGTAVAR
jgi:hypothetical protein